MLFLFIALNNYGEDFDNIVTVFADGGRYFGSSPFCEETEGRDRFVADFKREVPHHQQCAHLLLA